MVLAILGALEMFASRCFMGSWRWGRWHCPAIRQDEGHREIHTVPRVSEDDESQAFGKARGFREQVVLEL